MPPPRSGSVLGSGTKRRSSTPKVGIIAALSMLVEIKIGVTRRTDPDARAVERLALFPPGDPGKPAAGARRPSPTPRSTATRRRGGGGPKETLARGDLRAHRRFSSGTSCEAHGFARRVHQ